MTCFLTTHQPSWLAHVSIPLMVSRRRLAPRRTFPRWRRIGKALSITDRTARRWAAALEEGA